MAREDQSALVRLYLASALQRVPAEKRWDVVAGLLARRRRGGSEPAADGLVRGRAARRLDAQLPRVFAFTVQRIAAIGTQEALRVLTDRLGRTEDPPPRRSSSAASRKIVNKVEPMQKSNRPMSRCSPLSSDRRAAGTEASHTFKRIQLSDQFWSEGATPAI